ncbi:hypothetical protein ACOMHN_034573 [Nucella lapillus]
MIFRQQPFLRDEQLRFERSLQSKDDQTWTSSRPVTHQSLQAQSDDSRHHDTPLPHASPQGGRSASAQCQINITDRFDCFPESQHPDPDACRARGCCWDNSTAKGGVPVCYFSCSVDTYRVVSLSPVRQGKSVVGWNATLQRNSTSAFPDDVQLLRLLILYEARHRVRVKVFDPRRERYEVPVDLHDDGRPTGEELTDYSVTVQREPFSVTILRKADHHTLFDSRGMAPLIFADQYLQWGSSLSSPHLYGLGEHRSPLLLSLQWQKLVFWNRYHPPEEKRNLYGSHPFYLNLESSGNAHGVFLLNSNAMQVDLQPYQEKGAITYRVTGGILDFFVLSGPSAEDVVRQYVGLVGYPSMPPLWALGFHLCRHGYGNSSHLWKVIERNRAANIPYEAQWNDLDYSEDNKIWTWNNDTYRHLPDILTNLHAHGQRSVIIVDPGVSSSQPAGSYFAFDLGMKMDVFIKNDTGGLLIGKVWPGETAFVDFFHPKAFLYWLTCILRFHRILPFDGLWIDMNEPSNFVDGSVNGCTNNSLDKPPFIPPGIDGGTLYSRTTCPSARQYLSSHYNLHNLYGWSEAIITMESLQTLHQKRSLVLSRSTAPGSGSYGAHWSGDNLSSFPDMYFSIPEILSSNFFGMPLVGADICGFRGNTSRELCIRWMQLGAFYPFMRNHAEYKTEPQDPGWFDRGAQRGMRGAVEMRYGLLPYLYTRFFLAHTTGAPVVRPLFFDYAGTESIDRQFLWGQELLISPVLEQVHIGTKMWISPQGADKVRAYIPRGAWFDLQSLTVLNVTGDTWHTLTAPLDKINVHVRGGSILPMLPPALTTSKARGQKMELLVTPDLTSRPVTASGQLYWDDGESLEPVRKGAYSLVIFSLNKTTLTSEVQKAGYGPVTVGRVTVLHVEPAPVKVTLRGHPVPYSYQPSTKVLVVGPLSENLLSPFTVTWY